MNILSTAELKKMCEEDEELVKGVLELQSMLNEIHAMTEKPDGRFYAMKSN